MRQLIIAIQLAATQVHLSQFDFGKPVIARRADVRAFAKFYDVPCLVR